MILAHILAEDRRPADALWGESLVSSRLLQYEVWTRLHARRLTASHSEVARLSMDRVSIVEMTPPVLARALKPFPTPVRTLDALHLATMEFLREQGKRPLLASYDDRLVDAAKRLKFKIASY